MPAPLLARLSADSPAAVPDEQSGRSSRDETARDLERLRAVSAEAEEEVAAAAATGAHPLATAAQPVVQARRWRAFVCLWPRECVAQP